MTEDGSLLDSGDVVWDSAKSRPMSIRGEFPLPVADDFEGGVKAFLDEHSDELQLPPATELELVQRADTPTAHTVRFTQTHDGIPIFGTEVLVVVDDEQRVKQLTLHHEPRVRALEHEGDEQPLKSKDALKVARQAVGATARSDSPTPTEVYYPVADGLRRAFVVDVPVRDAEPHDWRMVIDAFTGEILEQEDLIVHVDGQGLVFDPNPVVTANNDALRDPDATVATCGFAGTARATIDAQRVTRTLRDITLAGGIHSLDGPFVRMRNFGAPVTVFPQEAGANNFNYSSGDERFEAVNVYYHVDTLQRYLQSIGITTAHNSVIECDPHEGSGAAFFSPIDGGLHFSDSGPCRPDRAEDGHVMVHEYGHAIQNDQVPNWGQTNPTTGRRETRAMGEGFGDALACIFFSDHGGGYHREVFEQWIFGDVGGLRRVDGTKVYPPGTGIVPPWTNGEHADGEIWSAALWNIFRAIGGDSMSAANRAAARRAILKSLVLSHHRLTASSSMPEGAEAVMVENAALPEYRGQHLMQMLDSFHARGLLACNPSANLEINDGPTFWNSPNLWVRHADDGLTTHQSPEFGQDNWFYARVQNVGTVAARAFVVTFNVKPWAGTEFTYPNDFVPYVSAAVGFNLAPGTSTVVRAKWPTAAVPPTGTHACLLASVYTPVDTTPVGLHVWEHNNLAQKNLTIVDLLPNDSVLVPVQLGNLARLRPERVRIEVRRPEEWRRVPVAIVHKDPEIVRTLQRSLEEVRVAEPVAGVRPSPVMRFLEPSRVEIVQPSGGTVVAPVRLTLARNSTMDIGLGDGDEEPANGHEEHTAEIEVNETDLVADREGAPTLAFRSGVHAGFPITLPPRSSLSVGLKITAPPEARPGDAIEIDLLQRDKRGTIVGGITVRANIVAKT